MGNFYKRESVTFPIPKSSGYLTSGIESFKGLHITDNPFVASQGSASDILNLYIDETNKLVTRPRLDFAYDIAGTEERLGTYIDSAHFDTYTIFLYKTSAGVKLVKRDSDEEINDIEAMEGYDISDKRLKCFEKDGVLYFLDGLVSNDKYYYAYLDGSTLKVVTEFYVPTTTIGRTSLVPGSAYEPLNSLTNKYRESWKWDGNWGIVDNGTMYTDKDRGLFISQTVLNRLGNTVTTTDNIVYMNTNGYVCLNANVFTCYDYNGNILKEYDLSETEFDSNTDLFKFNDDFEILAWVDANTTKPIIHIIYKNTDIVYDSMVSFNGTSEFYHNHQLAISGDGSLVFYSVGLYYESSTWGGCTIVKGILDISNDSNYANDYTYTTAITGYRLIRPFIKEDGSVIISKHAYSSLNGDYRGFVICRNIKDSSPTFVTFDPSYLTPTNNIIAVDYKNDMLILSTDTGVIYYNTITTQAYREHIKSTLITSPSIIKIHDSGFWAVEGDNLIYVSGLNTSMSVSTFLLDKTFTSIIADGVENIFYLRFTDTSYVYYHIDINSPLQEVVYERTIDEKHPDYADWYKLNSTNEFATMFTNFMTNYYVAQGKLLRASMYNNPLYFPITEYNEFNEDITGLNRLGDTLLAVYSSKNIYLQHPIYDESGGYKMASTETKAIKGNVAVNAPTVTYYSNYPVHIGKDGIYALQLEENVQSSERITVLITEGINKKLLDETLTNCMTFNNSYYTYFVFPLTTESHVYLLDNRTNEWFYWEIPIKIISMFEKDNKVYMMNDIGTVYRLEKEDELTDSNNPITIYSDEIANEEKITIPWLWRSQIMMLSHVTNPKQLYSTSFIMLDDDSQDNYGLTYKFTAFKKYFTSNTESLLTSGSINYIKTVTRRTYLSAFNFLQLELTNPLDDSVTVFDEQDSNKLNLVAIIFKYKVLPGGI